MSESFFAWLAIAALLLGLHAPHSSPPRRKTPNPDRARRRAVISRTKTAEEPARSLRGA